MRVQTIALAGYMLITSAAFTTGFAETPRVSKNPFDWIFFAIVGIPLVLGLVELIKPSR